MSRNHNDTAAEPPERDTIIVEDDVLREGFTQVPNLLLRTAGLTHGAKLAYALLLSYAWGDRRCFPGQEQLAKDMGVERKAVIRYLGELKEKQVIRVERRGMGKTNVYYLPRLTDVPILGHQEVPPAGQQDVPPMGQDKYPITKTQKDKYPSKIRKASQGIETGETTSPPAPAPQHPIAGGSSPPGSTGMEPIATLLTRRGSRSPAYNEDRHRILSYLQDISREFNDQAPLKSSVTRAYNLYRQSGMSIDVFTEAMYQARAITQERSAAIRSRAGDPRTTIPTKAKVAYYFAVLADLVGLKPEDGDIPQKDHP